MLGDPEGAWTAIDRLLERAGVFVGQIDWSDLWAPEMIPLRRDPRFHRLAGRLKFEPYWPEDLIIERDRPPSAGGQ